MNNIRTTVFNKFHTAIENIIDNNAIKNFSLSIQRTSRPEYGDYQANFAMALAKKIGGNPITIAQKIVDVLQNDMMFASLEVSGPGFINIKISDRFLENTLPFIFTDERLGIAKTAQPQTIIVEYGSPNVAKEMHVGHLRSTVIGDAIARILNFIGHHVIRQNHVGDWGTQFGMLIEYMIETNWNFAQQHSMQDLNTLYRSAKQKFDADPIFADQARKRVFKLQQGDTLSEKIWQSIVNESLQYFQTLYEKLDVLLTHEDVRGESFYNSKLANIVETLKQCGLAEISEGAMVVFLDGFVDSEKKPLPLIIQKSDGAYLYATTDLAAAQYRIETLKAERLIYVVDARQKQHFAMVFQTLREAKLAPEHIKLEHIPFGSVLGKDHKPFKTRSGETINLSTLLTEAENRAEAIITEKNPALNETERKKIATIIGMGALKYADLAGDKIKDYVFDWDKMLSFEGNTAPYLQNAYVRIFALFRKGNLHPEQLDSKNLTITESHEHLLVVKILEFSDVIEAIAENLNLHWLCHYLYEVASLFHSFYEHCPILSSQVLEIKISRLLICAATAKTLKLGLALLGIQVTEYM